MGSISSLQISGSLFPLGHEAERIFRRRLGREGFQPADRPVPDVCKRMHAAYSGPKHITGPGHITLPIENRFDLATEDEVRLFERMIVQRNVRALQIFDKQ